MQFLYINYASIKLLKKQLISPEKVKRKETVTLDSLCHTRFPNIITALSQHQLSNSLFFYFFEFYFIYFYIQHVPISYPFYTY